jgi:hypothetical protein
VCSSDLTISPNATIGANSGLDSGYSLLLKNSDTNYNGLGFRIDSTYGHMIETTRTGSAVARNLTMINNGGFFSVSETGNFGFNILAVNTGVDIYASTNAQLWLHNGANTGSTQGSRLAYFSNKSLNLRNFEGPLSLASEGDFTVLTLGAENIRVNSANGYVGIGNPVTLTTIFTVNGAITQSSVTSALLKTNASGTLVAAVAGTDYVIPADLSNYVPTSRTLTINGTSYDLSANRSWTIATGVTGTGTTDYIPKFTGSTSIGNSAITDDGTTVTLNSRVLAAPRARLNNGFDNASLTLNVGGQTYMDSRTSRLYQTFNLNGISNYMHIYDPFTTVNANGGFSIGASSSITLLPTTSIIHIDGVNSRVGIGTTAPSATLSVNGASYFSSSVTIAGGNFLLGGTSRLLYSNGSTVNNIYSGGTDGLRVMNQADSAILVTIANTGAATFSSSVTAAGGNSPTLGFQLTTTTGSSTPRITSDSVNATVIRTGASGSPVVINNFANSSELVRFTDGGNVGIGTSSPESVSSFTTLQIDGTSGAMLRTGTSAYGGYVATIASADVMVLSNVRNPINGTFSNTGKAASVISLYGESGNGYLTFSTSATNNTGPSERMRITSNGGVLIGKTAQDNTTRGIFFRENSWAAFTNNGDTVVIMGRNTNNGTILEFQYAGSVVGTISTNSNSLPSDKNFKKDISDISIGLNLINKLRPVHYRHKMDNDDEALSNGIIAQELEQSLLECGVEKNSLLMLQHKPNEKENESQYWVDYTKMIPILIKSIQEQQAQIEELKALINK